MRSEEEIRYWLRLHQRSKEQTWEAIQEMQGISIEKLRELNTLLKTHREYAQVIVLLEWVLGERDIQPGGNLRFIGERKE